MTAYEPLSARLNAAFDGCYKAHRASALSGVPQSTVYLWARNGLVTPSVSPTRVKLWSYADLMALRIVYWLRHPKFETKASRTSPARASRPCQQPRSTRALATTRRSPVSIRASTRRPSGKL